LELGFEDAVREGVSRGCGSAGWLGWRMRAHSCGWRVFLTCRSSLRRRRRRGRRSW
jgi:hypothetical protein